ncbi:MAG: hypothetical protein PHS48_09725 [Bacteroidales bacterium]|nr:hypothetical protein [Bacteroidales bacterium]
MIKIITEEGLLLDLEDSKRYIIWKMENSFSNISEFRKCIEIKDPSYWGEYVLTKDEKHYTIWINLIAETTLK